MEITDLRFLVVEDQGFQRWIVANILVGLGAQLVISAADGQEALDLLAGREPPIDIIVTDLDMPGMDGMEFIRHVGEGKYPAALILASAMEPTLIASVETMTRAYGVKILRSIPKPVTMKKLEAAIALYQPTPSDEVSADEPTFTSADISAGLKRGELEPYYQPKVDLKTQAIKGAEALVRWHHPELGIIRPDLFIAVAEESDLIDALTEMMIKAAARNCAAWRETGLDATVSVNLSPRSLGNVGLAERLIDDFGIGYSSLERLAGVPFTELKVDRSFVKEAATRKASRAMLESSLEAAQKLGIVAVAEGVENRAEWELVRTLGCHLAQGYYIARPMAAGEFQIWVEGRKKATA